MLKIVTAALLYGSLFLPAQAVDRNQGLPVELTRPSRLEVHNPNFLEVHTRNLQDTLDGIVQISTKLSILENKKKCFSKAEVQLEDIYQTLNIFQKVASAMDSLTLEDALGETESARNSRYSQFFCYLWEGANKNYEDSITLLNIQLDKIDKGIIPLNSLTPSLTSLQNTNVLDTTNAAQAHEQLTCVIQQLGKESQNLKNMLEMTQLKKAENAQACTLQYSLLLQGCSEMEKLIPTLTSLASLAKPS